MKVSYFNSKEFNFSSRYFCRELDVKISLEGYFNQAAIEKNPVHSPDGKWVVSFQAKYYKDSISRHKSKILESITNTKKYYPSVNKYYFIQMQNGDKTTEKLQKGKLILKNMHETSVLR